ncbi:unnamed protein product [Gongylonema pulchrum]|uniref:WD_REPEATS_REGION domain-containing protein n=1 Tax=Gongylonema pulchrum TaxID=637853 RepID=A0A183DRP0_9BILA|nr:unnamed protein product [Gongylonema pulchrum]
MTGLDQKSTLNKEPVVALVTTEFVPWCTKRFAEPILDVIQGRAGDGLTDRLATYAVPSDWALHKEEGLQQKSRQEIRIINERRAFDGRSVTARGDVTSTSLAWSQIRPHLYSCDGQGVTVWRCTSDKLNEVRKFRLRKDNALIEDEVTDLFVINEMTRELLMTCSEDGLMRIWDPGYSIHSYEFEDEHRMITAAYLLRDTQLTTPAEKRISSVYSWNQKRGLLAIAGNVKVCGLWDMHAEKCIQEIQIGAKNCAVTRLSIDNSSNELLALGITGCQSISTRLSDGLVNMYDPRLPPRSRRTMSLRELEGPVVGLSLFSNVPGQSSEGVLRLVAGARNGEIHLWEPRMFKEPVASFNACNATKGRKLTCMEVHTHGQFIGCVDDGSAVRLFDIRGNQLSELHQDEWLPGGRTGNLVSMRFHQLLVSFALSTQAHTITVYRMPDL